MTYDLAIGDRAYSSWSLRGWLLFDAFGIPVRTRTARLYTDELPRLLAEFRPAKTVPVARCPDGTLAMESLAIAEELASIAGKRLNVAPLSLCIERVEGERRLARTADPGEHNQPVAGQFEVDVAKIMLTGATNDDRAIVHSARL